MRSKEKHLKTMLALVLAASACLLTSWPAFAGEALKIGGVGSALGSMKLLGAAFEKLHQGTTVTVLRSLGSSGAIMAVSKGAIDIGLVGRALTEEEQKQELSTIKYAITPIVFAVKSDNSISGLSREDVIKMIKGNGATWPDGERARVVLRPASDIETIIIKKVMPDIGLELEKALVRGGRIIALTSQEAADAIENTPGAFGTSTLSLIESEKRPLRIVPFEGVSPNVENTTNGSYPFILPYSMLTKLNPSGIVRDFVAFVQSAQGKRILEESGNHVVSREK